ASAASDRSRFARRSASASDAISRRDRNRGPCAVGSAWALSAAHESASGTGSRTRIACRRAAMDVTMPRRSTSVPPRSKYTKTLRIQSRPHPSGSALPPRVVVVGYLFGVLYASVHKRRHGCTPQLVRDRPHRHPEGRPDCVRDRVVRPRHFASLPRPVAHLDRDVLPVLLLLRGTLCDRRLPALLLDDARSRPVFDPHQPDWLDARGEFLPALHPRIRGPDAAIVRDPDDHLHRDATPCLGARNHGRPTPDHRGTESVRGLLRPLRLRSLPHLRRRLRGHRHLESLPALPDCSRE